MQQTTLTAVFSHFDKALAAVKALQQAQLEVVNVCSPSAHRDMSEALGLKPSPVRYFTLLGGIAGGISGLWLAVYAASQWQIGPGGRPVVAWIPFVVVGFEFTILLAVLCTVAGMLISCRLPRRTLPRWYDRRFTRDKFGLLIYCPAGRCDEAKALLKRAGAEEIHEQNPIV
jgi:molybdopterin-containing oxidoreductase family membrane subunit